MWILHWIADNPVKFIAIIELLVILTESRFLRALLDIVQQHMQANESEAKIGGSAQGVKDVMRDAPLGRLARDIVSANVERIDGKPEKQKTRKEKLWRGIKMFTPSAIRWLIRH